MGICGLYCVLSPGVSYCHAAHDLLKGSAGVETFSGVVGM